VRECIAGAARHANESHGLAVAWMPRHACGHKSGSRITQGAIGVLRRRLGSAGTQLALMSRMETTELIQKITDDVKTIARGEVELVTTEIKRVAKTAATEAAVVLFGGIVTLIGFGLLCVAAVVALEPLIHSLAIRLVLMAIVYGALGGVLAGSFAMKLRRDVKPDLAIPGHEARSAIAGVKEAIKENPAHA
jgi:hypothetical protein